MTIKRFFVAVMALALAAPIFAKISIFNKDEKVYYGVRLGLTVSTVNSDEDFLDGDKSRAGLNIGFAAGIKLSEDYPVILESGLYYTEKGGEGRYDNAKLTYDMNYLEVPVMVKYKCQLGDDLSVQPLAGGYIAFGVSGKIKNYADETSRASFHGDRFQRFDGGLRLGCGVEYQMLYLEAAYDFGLSNISHSDFDSSRNGCFYINAGVNF